MTTFYLTKVRHGIREYASYSYLGTGVLLYSWTVGHGTPKARYRTHPSYFNTREEGLTELISRTYRDITLYGWEIAEEEY